MSKLKTQMSKVKKKTIPFRDSNRFYRGRIIDLLRGQSMPERKLLEELTRSYQKPKEFFDERISDLSGEGLIVRSKTGIVSLPEY